MKKRFRDREKECLSEVPTSQFQSCPAGSKNGRNHFENSNYVFSLSLSCLLSIDAKSIMGMKSGIKTFGYVKKSTHSMALFVIPTSTRLCYCWWNLNPFLSFFPKSGKNYIYKGLCYSMAFPERKNFGDFFKKLSKLYRHWGRNFFR